MTIADLIKCKINSRVKANTLEPCFYYKFTINNYATCIVFWNDDVFHIETFLDGSGSYLTKRTYKNKSDFLNNITTEDK